MSSSKVIDRDERTVAVENASYAIGYKVAAFALLFDVMYRSFALQQAPWDLLAIVIASGLTVSAYQAKSRILGRTWVRTAIIAIGIALVAAVILTLQR